MFSIFQRFLLIIFLIGFLLPLPVCAEETEKEGKGTEKTPVGMLRAIEQRNTELDQKAKQLELKEYRLRILEQEVSENLKKTKKFRDDMANIRAEQKAAEAKREADAKAAEAKRLADAKAAEAKRLADEKAAAKAAAARKLAEEGVAAIRREETRRAAVAFDKRAAEEKALLAKKAEEEDELLRKKEEERKALQTQQFAKLAKIYETMSPEDAALRLQNMKDEFALAIIPLMKDKKSARVLAAMDPIVAAKFTEKMGMELNAANGALSGKKNKR